MAISYPVSIDSLTNPISSNTLDNPSHAGQHSDINDAVEALEAKVGADSSAVTSSHDYKIDALETDVSTLESALPTGDIVGTTDTQTLTNKTLTNPKLNEDVAVTIKASELNGLLTGWIPAGETWTYASATTITVPSGAASKYQKGDKIKLTQTTVKYFYVVSVADTVLTVTGGSDYTVANAAITLPYFSKVENPQGFPGYFNCTLTASVSSGTLTTCTSIGRFSVDGSWVTLNGKITLTDKGTGSGVLRSTVPISAAGTISCVGFGRESGVSGADVQIYITTTLIIFYGMVITNGYETQYCIRYLYT